MFFASGFRQSSLRHVRAVRSVPSVQCVHLSTETPATPKKEAVGLKQLADAIAEKTGLSKDQSKEALSALIATISESLVNGKTVKLKDIGTFTTYSAKARTGRNPNTGEPLQIEAKERVKFSASSVLKKSVEEGQKE